MHICRRSEERKHWCDDQKDCGARAAHLQFLAGRLTSKQWHSMVEAMANVRIATIWWWRWSPAMDAARPVNL